MKYKAAMFDLDGTLLYTLKDICDSMNRVLKGLGYPAFPLEEYKYLVGEGGRRLAEKVIPHDKRNEAAISELYRLYGSELNAHWADTTRPYDGIPELLQALKGFGVKLAVLSNKSQELSRRMIERYFPDIRFDIVRGASAEYPLKPDPAAARVIAAELGIKEEEFIYIGDTGTDMQTANAAGMLAVGVLWGFRQYDELKENGARLIVRHPSEIAEWYEASAI